MNYGIHFHSFGEYSDPRVLADLAHEAEEAGWDGIFVSDHLTMRTERGPSPIADPWIALTAIAMTTRRVRIGPLVTPLPRRRPWQLASETVTLDRLSNGRLILGVGSGTGLTQSFMPFGEEHDLRQRAQMLDEGLDVLTGLWSGQPFSYQGEHYQVQDAVFLPTPVQSPRIPIWVAGHWPHKRPFRRAARWNGFFADLVGVDWVQGEIIGPDVLREIVHYVNSQRTVDRAFDAVVGGHTPLDRTRAAAILAPYVEAGLTWWIEGIHEAFGSFEDMRAKIRQGPPRG